MSGGEVGSVGKGGRRVVAEEGTSIKRVFVIIGGLLIEKGLGRQHFAVGGGSAVVLCEMSLGGLVDLGRVGVHPESDIYRYIIMTKLTFFFDSLSFQLKENKKNKQLLKKLSILISRS